MANWGISSHPYHLDWKGSPRHNEHWPFLRLDDDLLATAPRRTVADLLHAAARQRATA